MTDEEIDMTEAAVLDLIKIGAAYYPPLGPVAPFLEMFVRLEAHKLKIGISNGTIVPDGHGGLITKSWADDPRHALNPDGTFKF
jgi:hypothetical protein